MRFGSRSGTIKIPTITRASAENHFMKKNSHQSIINLAAGIFILALFGLGCGMVKSPFRDYKEKPFNSAEWLKGDAVERGRMYVDLFISRKLTGRSRDDVKELLGEPEKKQTLEGREVWLYYVELSGNTPMKYFPVSFEEKGGAFAGRVKGGTISMVVED
jgi:hypothetical protein